MIVANEVGHSRNAAQLTKASAGDGRLRVLHVIHSGALGGGPEMVRTLALADDGVIHAVVASADGPLLDTLRREHVETFAVPMFKKRLLPTASFRLRRLMRKWKPDVVVCRGQFGGFVGALASIGLSHRLIYVVAWPSYLSDKGPASRVRNWMVERMTTELSAATVFLSHADFREFKARRLVKAAAARVIPNAVDHHAYSPAGSLPSGKRIGFVGRLVADKGVDVLLDSLAFLPAEARAGLEVVIVGEGEEKDSLERRASAVLSAMPEPKVAVSFAGAWKVDRDWFTSFQMIVVPSRREPFGIVALEGMACGVPVIAARTGGLAEIIEHDVSGLLVPPDSASELARALVSVLTDGVLRARLASGGRSAIERSYTPELHVARYQELYRHALLQ